MATPAAYGSSQARGPIRPATASLHHSLKQQRILNPLNKARDQNGVLMDTGRVCYHWATRGTPRIPWDTHQCWPWRSKQPCWVPCNRELRATSSQQPARSFSPIATKNWILLTSLVCKWTLQSVLQIRTQMTLWYSLAENPAEVCLESWPTYIVR